MTIDDIALTLHADLGCRTAIHLVECFGSAEAVFAASADELTGRAQLRPALAGSLVRREHHAAAEREMEFLSRNRIRALAAWDEAYPKRLLECPDYPHVLYLKGDCDLNAGHWLSVVGTRKATAYGVRMCDRLIGELAALFPDLVIVSGLAFGIDIAAHRAAMEHGVPTIGILGHPLTHIYPQPHTDSARRMVGLGGGLISEFPSTSRPDKSGFVQRNRIIAGLSDGTVIVESAARGGSLITADLAGGYHREVMALPGRVGDRYAEGTNALIRSLKAQIVCNGQDIADALGWSSVDALGRGSADALGRAPAVAATGQAPESGQRSFDFSSGSFSPDVYPPEGPASDTFSQARPVNKQADTAARILELLGSDPVSLDELSLGSGIPVAELPALLLELELANRVRALPGNLYLRYR